ncbi:MAG: chromosome segregation protein SMC [bacterium]|nr:chromosome segregation protein SMC [bacterium]
MYLNEIRIYGFKSFPEPMNLKLSRGITGFVGPNGSGKSNVVDAIRWVLGEQSAKELRATLMEDLIFNGTQRKSAANLASASLKFSNEGELPLDFSELEIERKVYRSGESQYLINRETVRLKDIQNLLADTGLGARTYSLFKRSLIEDIVQNKPDALRNLFEESAGISLYRQSKRETLRKLIAAQENLYRINDLIQEIEKQEKELKKQTGRAKRYNEMTETVKHLGQHVFRKKDGEIKLQIENLDASIKQKKEKIDEIGAELDEIKEKILSARSQRKSLEDELSELNEKKEKDSQDLYRINSEMLVLNERIKSLDEQMNSKKEFKEKQILEHPAKKDRLKNNEERFASILQRMEGVMRERDEELNKDIEREYRNAQKNYDEIASSKRKLENDALLMRSKINAITIKKENQQKRMDEKQSEIEHEKNNILRLEQELAEKNKSADEAKSSTEELKKELAKLEDALGEKRIAQQSVFAEKEKLAKEISAEESKKEHIISRINESKSSLEEIEKALSGRTIEQMRNLVKPNEGYEDALKTALSLFLDAIVLTEGDLNKLENLDLPLLTVILSDFNGVSKSRSDTLDNFIDAPDYIKKFLSRFIVSNADEKYLGEDDGYYRIRKNGMLVTPDKLVVKSGEIKIVNFKDALEKAESRIEDIKRRIEENRIKLDSSRSEISSLNSEADKKKHALNESSNKVLFALETVKAIQKNIEAKNSYAKKLEENHQLLLKELDAMKAEEESISSLVSSSEKEISSLSAKCSEDEINLNALKEKYIVFTSRRGEIESIFESLSGEKAILEKEITDLKRVIESFETDVLSLDRFVDESSSQISSMKKSIDQREEEKGKTQSVLLKIDEQLKSLNDKIENIDNSVRSFEEKEDELRSILETVKTAREELLLQREKHMTERDFNKEHIDETVEIDNEIIAKYADNAEEELKYMSEKLSSMGPINQLAFQEYTEVAERLEQMVKQKDDIVQSKDNLEKTIKTIDAKAKTIFVQYFDTIKTTFKELFYEIFRNGNADISLVDETDPLESDIQIKFEPGEKKIGRLAQLSDGERAMMIILILFSMYMIKPTPVCIMDEIDAPLDDANVENFINLLKKFRDKTQFVLITHNKRTMEFCDYLFGVTMEESGVTSIFSLNLQTISQKFLEDVTQPVKEPL